MSNGYTVIHTPHVCAKPDRSSVNTGTVIQCNVCGQQWRLNYLPNTWMRVKTNVKVADQ